MFVSLLAASVDGLISGFIIGGTSLKFSIKDFFKAFGIIFCCCGAAAIVGIMLAQTQLRLYINIMGIVIMIALAWSSLCSHINTVDTGIYRLETVAFSVAMDASIVCLYLALRGYNIILISLLSASMHSVLMAVAAFISNKIIKEKWIFYTRYIAGITFLCMALIKMLNLQ